LQEEVLPLARRVLGPEHPHTLLAMNNLATSYERLGRRDEALKMVEDVLAVCLERDPKSLATAEAYAELGFKFKAMGRAEEAIKAWRESVAIGPAETGRNIHYYLGSLLVDSQLYSEALPSLRAAQKSSPDGELGREVAELLSLAESVKDSGSPNTGPPDVGTVTKAFSAWLTSLEQWVAAHPVDTHKVKQLATVYLWLGRTNEHLAVCRRLLDSAATSADPSTLDRAAKAYLIQSHPDSDVLKQAIAAGRRALKVAKPGDYSRGFFMVTAAMAALRDRAPAEAEPLLTEAIGFYADDWDRQSLALAYRMLARAYQGKMDEARADLAELEKCLPLVQARPTLSPIVFRSDAMAACLAHEEAKELLSSRQPGTHK
jgi:tetratricopeptide (TPR) repeat protein